MREENEEKEGQREQGKRFLKPWKRQRMRVVGEIRGRVGQVEGGRNGMNEGWVVGRVVY